MKTARRILKTLVTLAILGGVGAAGYYSWEHLKPGPVRAADSIPLVEVREGVFRRTVSSIGELKAARSSMINAPFNGQVTRLVPEGTRVAPGDPVIWLDTDSLTDNLRDEEASLLLARKDLEAAIEEYELQEIQNEYNLQSELARVELAEQRLEDAQQKFESERILVERRISPQNRLEEVRLSLLQSTVELRNARINLRKTEENLSSNLRVSQAAIDRAELEVERVERRIADLEERIEESIIRSPENGEVAYVRVYRSGQMAKVAEGDSVWPRLTLAEIPDRSEMLAVIPVNELDVANVESGQPARITLDALPGEVYEGVVERKSVVPIDQAQSRRGGSSSTGPREFEVEVKLLTSDPRFFQGMTATVEIRIHEEENAKMVPLETLTLGEGGDLGVFRHGGGAPEFIPVSVRSTNAQLASVVGALSAGDRLYSRHPDVDLDQGRELSTIALRRLGEFTVPEDLEQEGEEALEELAGSPGGTGASGS